ncbi:MAG: hypothetical protein ACYTE6_01755 [Planctomycetota bacterium]|jgi:hypothetical protein
MGRRGLATSKGIPTAHGPIMLGLGWLLLASGCGTGGEASYFVPITGGPPPERRPEPPPPRPVERPAEPAPTDSGADALLRSIWGAIESQVEPSSREVRIGMEGLRNQSHASGAEFIGLRLRLAEVLTRSGLAGAGGRPIRFVASSDEPVDFNLIGAAYLVGSDGDGQWELFLALHPPGRQWVIWRADGPVRMPRRQRPGEPQIILR